MGLTADEAFHLLRGDGQPYAFVVLATEIAASADKVVYILRVLTGREKPPSPLPPVPGVEDWLPLYRRHRLMTDRMWSSCGLAAAVDEAGEGEPLPDGVRLDFNAMMDGLRELSRGDPAVVREALAMMRELDPEAPMNMLRQLSGVPFPPKVETVRLILQDMDTDATDPEDDAGFESMLADAGGQFYFRVWLPCWILYREYPGQLLRKARLGDDDAFERLLRLDKSVQHDPVLSRRLHEVDWNGSKRDRDRFRAALAGDPKGTIDAKSVRYGLAGLISQLATVFKTSVTAPKIQELFDAVERAKSGEVDRSIPSGEAFTKAIQRNRDWPSMPKRRRP